MDWANEAAYADLRHRCVALRRALREYEGVYMTKVRDHSLGPPGREQVDRNIRSAELTDAILAQANHLRKAMASGPVDPMEAELADRVRHLRNLYEHWEQHRHSFSNPALPKNKSGEWYAKRFPDKTPWSSAWGVDRGFEIGGIINLRELHEVVDEVERALPPID